MDVKRKLGLSSGNSWGMLLNVWYWGAKFLRTVAWGMISFLFGVWFLRQNALDFR